MQSFLCSTLIWLSNRSFPESPILWAGLYARTITPPYETGPMQKRFSIIKTLIAATASILLMAPDAMAAPGDKFVDIRSDEHIHDRLLAVAVGYRIQKECPEIAPRWFRLWQEKSRLERYAISAGYSADTVSDYIASREEKNRMNDIADAWISSQPEKGQDLCALGHAQIDSNTYLGSLMRTRVKSPAK